MADSKNDRRVLLGQIATAHGIRGEVLVKTYTASPETIAAYGPLSDKTGTKKFVLRVARVTAKGVVARIDGVADRNAAEKLRGQDLYVARSSLPDADDTEYYHTDLIGLEARTADGTRFGDVIAVQNFGAGDLLEVRLTDGRTTDYIPFTNAHVPFVDLAEGHLTIVPPTMTGDPEPDDGDSGEPLA